MMRVKINNFNFNFNLLAKERVRVRKNKKKDFHAIGYLEIAASSKDCVDANHKHIFNRPRVHFTKKIDLKEIYAPTCRIQIRPRLNSKHIVKYLATRPT